MTRVTSPAGTAKHWNDAYRQGDTVCSWFQPQARPSLHRIEAAGIGASCSLIDVGGGTSRLVDALIDRGHTDLTVLDISAEAVHLAQRRLGSRASQVDWLVADLCTWTPHRTWNVWHDRAVLHFFATKAERQRYLHALNTATEPGSHAIIATFAPDGPRQCSGLPVSRYDAHELAALLGHRWQLVAESREPHTTPAGGTQPFTWATLRRQS